MVSIWQSYEQKHGSTLLTYSAHQLYHLDAYRNQTPFTSHTSNMYILHKTVTVS